jgi:hypothetical protein
VTVALTQGMPEARGHTWTTEDYDRRDAAFAALGMEPPRRKRARHAER